MRSRYAFVCGALLALAVVFAPAFGAELPDRRYYVNTVFSWWPTYTDFSLFQKFVDASKRKGMNCISLDIPWTIQGDDGGCGFTEPDRRVDYVISRGMSVFVRVNTTTAGGKAPKWLTNDMLQCTRDGKVYKRDTDGGMLPSLAHPAVRDHIVRFFRDVARHYGARYERGPSGEYPVVALSAAFDLYMESEYTPDADVDYCAAAEKDFAAWARSHYKSLADLNAKWGKSLPSWDKVSLKDAHDTARELYFEFTLQRVLDLIGDTVHQASSLAVGMQTGSIWDNPHRRTMNVTPLLRKLDWLFIADGPDYNHAFSTDYARCSAPGKSVGNEIDAATHPLATGGRYFNQGVRAFEHGARAVFVANWDISSIRDNDKWPFLHFVGKIARSPAAHPRPERAIYVSTWDLINRAAAAGEYMSAYDALSDGGKQSVDVLPDCIIATNPGCLSSYREVHLPANWTIPPDVRRALSRVQARLKVAKPLVAGTLDEYGRPTEPLVRQ